MTLKYNHRNWLAFGLLDPREKTIGHWMREVAVTDFFMAGIYMNI